LLSWFSFLTGCSIFFFGSSCFGNLGWFSAGKAFFGSVQVSCKIQFHVTSRSSTSRYAPWTVFKSQFCGFAAQKYSTKLQLKTCRLARRYIGQEIKSYSCGEIAKAKAMF
jgi:hypothetical protein